MDREGSISTASGQTARRPTAGNRAATHSPVESEHVVGAGEESGDGHSERSRNIAIEIPAMVIPNVPVILPLKFPLRVKEPVSEYWVAV